MPLFLPFRRRPAVPPRRPNGVHIQRLGGAPVWSPGAVLPRVGAVLALRCFVVFPRPRAAVVVRMDGRFLARVALPPPTPLPDGRGRQVANAWLDLSGLAPGRHRVTVEPEGPFAWYRRRGRKFIRTLEPFRPGSDASLPDGIGPDLEAGVAALPSVVRPARRSVLPMPVRRILVVRADQLGDLAVSIPAVQRLRAIFPDAGLTLIATAGNEDFARATGLFAAVVPIRLDPDAPGPDLVPPAERAVLADRLGADRFDLAVDLGEGARSRWLLLLADGAFTYGFRHGDHGWLSASFELNGRDPLNGLEVIPPARKLLAMVDALGAMAGPPVPPLRLQADPALLARHGIVAGGRFVLLHAGARLAYSRWPHMAALARRLLDVPGLSVVVFAQGPGDVPDGLAPDRAGRVRVVEGLLPFAEFDALVAAAAVVVANDSGPKHLAAVRGTRVVSLHTARLNWNEWGQEGDGAIISRRVPCAGCGIAEDAGECGRGVPCLTGITPDEVFETVLSLL